MTWYTDEGDVVLDEPAMRLLIEAACHLRDEIILALEVDDPELEPDTGVPVLDSLEAKTKIFGIAYVLRYLSDPDLPSPDLYAWNEGTLLALFNTVEIDLEFELDTEESPAAEPHSKYSIRRLVLRLAGDLRRVRARDPA